MAMIARGRLGVHPSTSAGCAFSIEQGMLVRRLTGPSMPVDTRWIAGEGAVRLIVWEEETVNRVLGMAGELEAVLRKRAARAGALAFAALGPLGRFLCDSTRAELFNRSGVRSLSPGGLLVGGGDVLPGLVVVSSGELCSAEGEGPRRRWSTGELVAPDAVLSRSTVRRDICAGEEGATILVTDPKSTHELLCMMPDLLELMSRF
jgi:hypothetical protein